MKKNRKKYLFILPVLFAGVIAVLFINKKSTSQPVISQENQNSELDSVKTSESAKDSEFMKDPDSNKDSEFVNNSKFVAESDIPVISNYNQNSLDLDDKQKSFCQSAITKELFQRIDGGSYKKDCTVPLEELRYLKVLYYGFDQETHTGELIVNKDIAEDTLNVFRDLYEEKYPIEKIKLIDEYNAVDNDSMADNNTSAFNFRYIDGTKKYSNHAQGRAIDINPFYNPYVRTRNGQEEVLPPESVSYSDRNVNCEYYIKKNDVCYRIFQKYGFSWGGDWTHSKDYQHFEKK